MQDLLKRSRAYISQEPQRTNRKHHPDSHGKARAYDPRGDCNRDDGRDRNHDHKDIQDRSPTLVTPRKKTETFKLTSRSKKNDGSNWFIDGEGINRAIMKREIYNLLGPEYYSRAETHNSVYGYIVEDNRPFTSDMMEHLRAWSKYIQKNFMKGYHVAIKGFHQENL